MIPDQLRKSLCLQWVWRDKWKRGKPSIVVSCWGKAAHLLRSPFWSPAPHHVMRCHKVTSWCVPKAEEYQQDDDGPRGRRDNLTIWWADLNRSTHVTKPRTRTEKSTAILFAQLLFSLWKDSLFSVWIIPAWQNHGTLGLEGTWQSFYTWFLKVWPK